MATPAFEFVFLRFVLHEDTDGLLMVRRRSRSQAAEIPDLRDLKIVFRLLIERGLEKVHLAGDDAPGREDLPALVHMIARQEGIREVTLSVGTANIGERIAELSRRGLHGVSFNLPSLKPERYTAACNQAFDSTWRAVEEALANQLVVKLNVALRRGFNDDEIGDFVDLATRLPVFVRFLEWNPDTGPLPPPDEFVPSWKAMSAVGRALEPFDTAGDPARVYRTAEGAGAIGFVANVSDHFCAACRRIVLSDYAEIASCRFGRGASLIPALRSGDAEVRVGTALDRLLRRKNALAAKLTAAAPLLAPAEVVSSAAFASGLAADGLGNLAADPFLSLASSEETESTVL